MVKRMRNIEIPPPTGGKSTYDLPAPVAAKREMALATVARLEDKATQDALTTKAKRGGVTVEDRDDTDSHAHPRAVIRSRLFPEAAARKRKISGVAETPTLDGEDFVAAVNRGQVEDPKRRRVSGLVTRKFLQQHGIK